MELNSDIDLFKLFKTHLFTAVVGDIMDQMNLLHQFLPPTIQPLSPEMIVLGRAMPVLEEDVQVNKDGSSTITKPFGVMLEALDDLKTGEVYVCSGSSPSYAMWGELMSTRAIQLGAAGVVADGYVRDTNGILALNFPTFCFGSYAQDQAPRGQVVDFRIPIQIGSVQIHPGDIIFGDIDGVLVIPAIHELEIIERSMEKATGEQLVRKAIQNGMSAVDAFNTYGIM